MQTQFQLTKDEVNGALQVFIAKAYRNKNLTVQTVTVNAEGTAQIGVEVSIVAPKPRAARKSKASISGTATLHTKK